MLEVKPFRQLLSLCILYTSQIMSFIIFIYIFLAHIIGLILPTESLIDQQIYDLNYLRFLVFLGLMLGFIGWVMAFLYKQVNIVSPLSYSINEKISLALTSLFLTTFYNSVFASLHIFQYLIFFSLIAIFFILLPQLIQLYLSFRFKEFKSLIAQTYIFSKKNLTRKSSYSLDQIQEFNKKIKEIKYNLVTKSFHFFLTLLFTFFSLAVIILSFFYVSNIINNYIQGTVYRENLRRRQFFITKITPQKTMQADTVKLEGYHFGSKIEGDNRYSLMTSDGSIRLVEEWTNERLDFIVPLELSTGKKEVWIERPSDDQSNSKVIKSNIVSLEIFSRFNLYPAADDSLYERAIKKIKRFIYFKIPFLNRFIL